jgi:uncharacterized protein (DUF302 family)
MNAVSPVQTYLVPARFEKALKGIRVALGQMGLDVVEELESLESVRSSRILLVSCPLLDLEAVALSRAAAVFFPLHVLVCSESERTRVSMINPTGLFEARLPVGAGDPMDRLVARVTMALDSLSQRPVAGFNRQPS